MEKVKYLYSENIGADCVLFLHGWGGNEYSFISTFNQLKPKFSVLSINLTDINSNYLSKPLSLYDYAVKVYMIVKELGVKNIHIVCHSFGFRLALILNKMFKLNIKSMVVVDGAGINTFDLKKNFNIFKFKICKKLVRLKLLNKTYLNKFGSSDYKVLDENLKITFKNIVNYDLQKYVDSINVKTTIVWGKYDKDTKLKVAKYLHKNIKLSTLKIYNAGHFSYIDYKHDFMCDIEEHFNSI